MAEPKLHVMALTADLQVALRLIMENNLKIQIRFVLDQYELNREARNPVQSVQKLWNTIVKLFDNYEELTGSLASPQALRRTPSKLFTFSPYAMRYILQGINRFDPEYHGGLESDAITFVNSCYNDIKNLVETSLKHEYTLREIEGAKA